LGPVPGRARYLPPGVHRVFETTGFARQLLTWGVQQGCRLCSYIQSIPNGLDRQARAASSQSISDLSLVLREILTDHPTEDLLKRFDEVRRREQLDATVAEMLQRN